MKNSLLAALFSLPEAASARSGFKFESFCERCKQQNIGYKRDGTTVALTHDDDEGVLCEGSGQELGIREADKDDDQGLMDRIMDDHTRWEGPDVVDRVQRTLVEEREAKQSRIRLAKSMVKRARKCATALTTRDQVPHHLDTVEAISSLSGEEVVVLVIRREDGEIIRRFDRENQ